MRIINSANYEILLHEHNKDFPQVFWYWGKFWKLIMGFSSVAEKIQQIFQYTWQHSI